MTKSDTLIKILLTKKNPWCIIQKNYFILEKGAGDMKFSMNYYYYYRYDRLQPE